MSAKAKVTEALARSMTNVVDMEADALRAPVPAQPVEFTAEQVATIRRAIAPDATNDELAMFLHAAKKSGLDPLRREIYFTKDRNGRMAIIAGIDGLQKRAEQFPDYQGLRHAVVFEKDDFVVDQVEQRVIRHLHNPLANNGRIVGAWAVVERAGRLPVLSVVAFSEYVKSVPGKKINWDTMPRVMIDKVAKSTALRLAFPGPFGGIYDPAELGSESTTASPPQPQNEQSAGMLVDTKPPARPTPAGAARASIVDASVVTSPAAAEAPAGPVQDAEYEGFIVPFGNNKGLPVTQVDERELAYLEAYFKRAIDDPKKVRFQEGNRNGLAAVKAEQARRARETQEEPPQDEELDTREDAESLDAPGDELEKEAQAIKGFIAMAPSRSALSAAQDRIKAMPDDIRGELQKIYLARAGVLK